MPQTPPAPGMTTRGTPRKQVHRKADATVMQNVTKAINPRIAAWQRRSKALGLHQRQVVFELHCRQGYDLTEVAEMLGVSFSTVSHHWKQVQDLLIEQAPRSPEQLTAMREKIAAGLWATVETTFCRMAVGEGDDIKTVELPATPQMLAIRLKAYDQLAKLYGVNMEQIAESRDVTPYASPQQLAGEVQRKVLELHGRKNLLPPPAA